MDSYRGKLLIWWISEVFSLFFEIIEKLSTRTKYYLLKEWMIRCICLDIDRESLPLVVDDITVDILFHVILWEREIELKRQIHDCTDILVNDG